MARQTNVTSHFFLHTQCAVVEWASLATLTKFQDQVCLHDIPYWGLGSLVRLQDSVQGVLRKVPIAILLTLPTLPIWLVYPILDAFYLTHHNCIHCLCIDFPGTNNPAYKFYLSPTGERLPPATQSHPCPPPWPSRSPVACKATLVT
jgi:hypothetical protein